MARRLKSTPFARFLLAMLIIIPLAYFGAAYYNGEDPVEKIKDTLGIEENKVVQVEDNERVSADAENSYDLRQEIEQLKERIRDLEEENQLLKEKVHELQMRE